MVTSVAQGPLVLGGTLHGDKCGTGTIGIGGEPSMVTSGITVQVWHRDHWCWGEPSMVTSVAQ